MNDIEAIKELYIQYWKCMISKDEAGLRINESLFAELGRKYGKSSAQVILHWHTQMGFVVIPGSKNVDHIKDNLDILDFTLTEEEMAEIAKLDKKQRYYHRTDEQLVQFAGWKPSFEQK